MMETDVTANALMEALPYINYFAGKTVVIKIGGSTLGAEDTTLQDIVLLRNLNIIPVVVHGGGNAITQWLNRIGKQARFVNGLRVTDEETMEIVRMTLVGKVNTELVSTLNSMGARAVGISGLDARLLGARRMNPELGLVGEVTAVDLTLLTTLVQAGYIVVIAPIGIGEEGEALNLNADTAAGEIAAALKAEKLIMLTDVPGIKDKQGRLISACSREEAETLIADGTVSGGMIPKVRACLRALDGVRRTHIIDGRVRHALIRELFTNQGVGTMIVRTLPEAAVPTNGLFKLIKTMGTTTLMNHQEG
jgi:acetylglutamate kinase